MALGIRRRVEGIARWSQVDRVRAAASVVAGMGLGNVVLTRLTPVYVASAVPLWVWTVVAVAGLMLAAGARHVVAAWPESMIGRIVRSAAHAGYQNRSP